MSVLSICLTPESVYLICRPFCLLYVSLLTDFSIPPSLPCHALTHSCQTNHGAYGGTPRPVIAYQYSKVAEMEARIDPWFNNPSGGYQECIHEARALLAGVINSNVNDTVLVDNASEAVNDILRNMEPPLGPDQWILDLSTAYAPFQGFYSWLTARLGVQVLQVPIAWPVTGAASFVDPVRAALANATQQGLRIRIAVISHISAYPAVVLPVRALVDVLHAAGIPVIIDGAHCLGNIAIDIEALGDPEFYFANAHKWYFSAKSAAVLYVRRDQQQKYVPAPSVVDNPETQTFADRFYWTGCVCVCALVCLCVSVLFFVFGLRVCVWYSVLRVSLPCASQSASSSTLSSSLWQHARPHRVLLNHWRQGVSRQPRWRGGHYGLHAVAGRVGVRTLVARVASAAHGASGHDEFHGASQIARRRCGHVRHDTRAPHAAQLVGERMVGAAQFCLLLAPQCTSVPGTS